ncbi:glycyl-radical enzyme activating protein [Christensenellaceae bacterium OttesenSCG-928-K19]|nr:glycyl-radical enzyme activating protein [Christensenellaceae bacterium OttesenSCG-928-K19]
MAYKLFWSDKIEQEVHGVVFNIEKYHVHDGEGIRTNVFLKGCNLWCPWCCNPESQAFEPQIAVHENICTRCGLCVGYCPQGAISQQEDGRVVTDKKKCTLCGVCEERCLQSARELYGEEMSVAEVIAKVEQDSAYYKNSGGGLTISGGEPCMQVKFASELAQAARRRYIHVAMETAGAVPWEDMWEVAQYVDDILFDMKFSDDEGFAKVSNLPLEMVKENMKKLVENGKHVIMRCPIIPGYNYTPEHFDNIAKWAGELGIKDIDLLAFHQLGKYKYDSLEMGYGLTEQKDIKKEDLEPYKEMLIAKGFNAGIGG